MILIIKSLKNIALIVILLCAASSCKKDSEEDNIGNDNNPVQAAQIYDFIINSISLTEKQILWKCNNFLDGGFKVERKAGNNPWIIFSNVLSNGNQYIFTDTAIVPDYSIAYTYKISGTNIDGKLIDFDTVIFFGIPQPDNIQIQKLNDVVNKISWTDNCNGEDGYKIDRRMDQNNWIEEYAILDPGTEEFTDTAFKSDTDISFRVYTYYKGFISNKVEISVNSGLQAPTNLNVYLVSDVEIGLSWTDNSDGEQGYLIDKKVGNASWQLSYTTLAANSNAFTDNVAAGSTDIIYYRVYSFYKNHTSDPTESNINTACPAVMDNRDGKVYSSVQIGTQCWMQENLNYEGEGMCYENDPANCDIYGRLYDWYAALEVCPSGWHLPHVNEWEKLINYLGGEEVAGGKLKSTSHWSAPNTGATNSSNFSALPGGYHLFGVHAYIGAHGFFWTADVDKEDENRWGAIYYSLHYNDSKISQGNYYESAGRSVRCVRD